MTLNDFNKTEILQLIATQLNTIVGGKSMYDGYTIKVAEEQEYIQENMKPNEIYLVVKFLPATINFGQTILPITINALGENNALEICNTMLTEFALQFNMEFALNDTVRQFYNTPYVLSNFNDISTGHRSLMSMSGTLQINKTSNPKKIYIYDDNDNLIEIPCITSNLSFESQLDPQSFFNESNITKSEARVGTWVLTLVAYDMDSYFQNEVLKILTNSNYNFADTQLYIRVEWKNGQTKDFDFFLKSYNSEQNVGEMPVSSYVLVE